MIGDAVFVPSRSRGVSYEPEDKEGLNPEPNSLSTIFLGNRK
jgi:hypothetical protein